VTVATDHRWFARTDMTKPNELHSLNAALREELESRHGPLMGGRTLIVALGLASAAALRQARKRGHVAVTVFRLPKRRGVFALTRDVAEWLAQARAGCAPSTTLSTLNQGATTDEHRSRVSAQKRKSPRCPPRASRPAEARSSVPLEG